MAHKRERERERERESNPDPCLTWSSEVPSLPLAAQILTLLELSSEASSENVPSSYAAGFTEAIES